MRRAEHVQAPVLLESLDVGERAAIEQLAEHRGRRGRASVLDAVRERERQSGAQVARLQIARDFGRATDQRLAHVRAELGRALAEERERRQRVRPDEPAQTDRPDA